MLAVVSLRTARQIRLTFPRIFIIIVIFSWGKSLVFILSSKKYPCLINSTSIFSTLCHLSSKQQSVDQMFVDVANKPGN